ncbi:MAG: MBL fold metallo-hydrolase [Fibrobacter sp.]|nr:MBL fold metallo-hydrolase [Fibrobacter sp.]
MLIKIYASEQRLDEPQVIHYQNEITITTWGAIRINSVHFFPSGFQIRSKNLVVYIDPVKVTAIEKADYIFITHSHPDHLSINDIKQIMKAETRIICPKSVGKKLKKLKCEITATKPGDKRNFNGIQCIAVPAYNTRPVFLWIKAHPKSRENCGYLITFNENVVVYHAGDTDNVPELGNINNVDIAFLPVGGDNLTMNIIDAAELANRINPKVLIPMHFDLVKTNELQRLRNLLSNDIKMESMIKKRNDDPV